MPYDHKPSLILLVAVVALLGVPCLSAADDEAVERAEPIYLRLVFGQEIEVLATGCNGGYRDARRMAERLLRARLDRYEGALSTNELGKLEVAGHIDISDFFADVEALKDEHAGAGLTCAEVDELHRRCTLLRSRLWSGLHRRGSLYQKTARLLLDKAAVAELPD